MPILYAIIIVFPLFYVVEILAPYVESKRQEEKQCIEKGGALYEIRQRRNICVKDEHIIRL